MNIKYNFTEVFIDNVKHYRSKATFEINGKIHQANLQSLEPITEDIMFDNIKDFFNANSKA